MGQKSKRAYLLAIWERYQRVGRRFKTKILDEFCSVCGYSRKYAIRLLGRQPGQRRKKPGPRRRYDGPVLAPLKAHLAGFRTNVFQAPEGGAAFVVALL